MRAEFEARAQVDLTLRAAGGGDLEAVCDGLAATVTWRPRSGGKFERGVSAASPAALVDALLFAVAELAGDAARVARPHPTPLPETDPSDEPPATDAQPPASPERNAADRPSAVAGPAIPFGLLAGGTAALLSTSGAGVVGPNVGLLFGLSPRAVLTLEGGYGFGFGVSNSAVSVHTLETMALASTTLGSSRAYELGGGLVFGSLSASTDSQQFTSTSGGSKVYLGGVVRARYGAMIGGVRVSFGPELRLNVLPTQVVVINGTAAEESVWQISTFSAGLTLEFATSLYGSLW
jgi:hypothetical protein